MEIVNLFGDAFTNLFWTVLNDFKVMLHKINLFYNFISTIMKVLKLYKSFKLMSEEKLIKIKIEK